MDFFTKLRFLLFEPPGVIVWRQLCRLLDRCPDGEDLEVALSYAQEHLQVWPDALRRVPRAWFLGWLRGTSNPRARLARHLDLSGLRLGAKRVGALLVAVPTDVELRQLSLRNNRLGPLVQEHPLWKLSWCQNIESLDMSHNVLGATTLSCFARCAHWSGVESLQLRNTSSGARGLQFLYQCTHLQSLRALDMGSQQLTADDLLFLERIPWLSQLEQLDLSNNPLGDRGLRSVLERWELSGLQTLSMRGASLGKEGLEILSQSRLVPQLEALDLSQNNFGAQGSKSIVRGTTWRRLQQLSLCSCDLQSGGSVLVTTGKLPVLQRLFLRKNAMRQVLPEELPTSERTAPLIALDLSHNELCAPSIDTLMRASLLAQSFALDISHNKADALHTLLPRASWLYSCSWLNISHNQCTDQALADILLSPQLASVRVLRAAGNAWGEQSWRALKKGEDRGVLEALEVGGSLVFLAEEPAMSQCSRLSRLRWLSVRSDCAAPETWRFLGRCTWLVGLEELDLSHCGLQDNALAHLVDSEHFSHLKTLRLGWNQFSARSVELLQKAPWLAQLQQLDLRHNSLGDTGANSIANWSEAPNLLGLDLDGNSVGESGRVALQNSRYVDDEIRGFWSAFAPAFAQYTEGSERALYQAGLVVKSSWRSVREQG